MRRLTALVMSLALVGLFLLQDVGHAVTFVRVGTASVGGAFYPMGNAIAQLLNRELRDLDIRASAQATGGSSANVVSLYRRDLEIALSQSTAVAEALQGTTGIDGNQIESNVRTIAVVNLLIATAIVRDDPAIQSLADLRGRRVAVGPIGGGIEVNTRTVLSAYGIGEGDFRPEYSSTAEALDMLKLGQVDAMIYFEAPGAAHIGEVLRTGRVKILPLEEEIIAKLLETNPELVPATLKAGTYARQDHDVPSVASATLLLTHAGMDEEIIYQSTKAMFSNLEFLRERHSAFDAMSLENATLVRLLPYHPGAERFYQEVGAF